MNKEAGNKIDSITSIDVIYRYVYKTRKQFFRKQHRKITQNQNAT